MNISVDCSQISGPLKPFWQSMGFTPASLLLTNDMRQQIIYCGSIPRNGIKYARIHYLLELVDASFEKDAGVYNWSRLDHGLDLLIQNDLVPIFEIMGNPGGQFNDFNDDLQLRRWKNLVRDLADHLIERYGQANVKTWYFETWNEPDGGFGWSHQWPHDEMSFCNYYDACVTGLGEADPNLVLGGPGTCQTLSNLFKAFLAHCEGGSNYFTGEKGLRLDFISIHEKGMKPHKEDLTPSTNAMLTREEDIVRYIREHHPGFADTPFMNNECDPQVGWSDIHTWHARPYYAAWVCKSVIQHLERLVDGMGVLYAILSNDNGFIGTWGNRTLFTRFGPSHWIEDGQGGHANLAGWSQREFETPPYAMVKKPVFNAMTLLSLLGEERFACSISGSRDQPVTGSSLDVLAARSNDGCIEVLISYSHDRMDTCGRQAVRLEFDHLPFKHAALIQYCIDGNHPIPFQVWEEAGAPDTPGDDLLASMREVQETAQTRILADVTIRNRRFEISFDLPLHGVSLILLVPQPEKAARLPNVTGLQMDCFEGLNKAGEYLLHWKPLNQRSLATYEVLMSSTPDGPFFRSNPSDLICSAYLVTRPGYYKVRAKDVWGEVGPESEVIFVG